MTSISRKLKNSLHGVKISLIANPVILPLLMVILLSHSCASIQQPTGGPKDTIPPEIVEESPKNFSTNFSADEISITFNEYVKLQNEFSEVSISPEMVERPILKIKKKSLIITLPDSLEKNTTYTINFGKALVDFNESNELKNYYYVFSTGDEIDSLTISGNVKDAFSLEPKLDATVILIPTSRDTIFRKHKASIFTRTDSSGNFEFRNQKEDTYHIYALVESDNDRIFNKPSEQIAFLKDSIYLNKDTSGIQLSLFREIPEKFRILNKAIQKSGLISLGFNKEIPDPTVKILNIEQIDATKKVEFNEQKDSVSLWVEDMSFDSLSIQINAAETALDTTVIKRNESDEYERNILLKDNLTSQMVNRVEHLVVTSSAPIKTIDRGKIIFTEDSIAIPKYILSFDTMSRRSITIAYPWRKDRKYEIIFQEKALSGFFGAASEEYIRSFTYDDSENFGDFIINLQAQDSSQYIVELVKLEDGETIDSRVVSGSQYLKYKNLPGIKLGIRIIYDENHNNRWDTGNVYKAIYPEKVWYFNKVITIRPNWEQEEIIQIPSKTSLDDLDSTRDQPVSAPDSSQSEGIANDLEYIKEGIIETKDSIIIKEKKLRKVPK